MAAQLEDCRFFPTLGGTTDWTYSSAVIGYQSPTLAGAVNTLVYAYRAESADLSQWEEGEGAFNSGVFSRTTVFYNSAGTGTAAGQSGAGTKINFTSVPQVAIIFTRRQVIGTDEANSFSTAQKKQAQSNILVAPTVTVLTSGTGLTYTTPAGCTRIRVRMAGGGGGGSSGGTTATVAAGTGGTATTFGPMTANGGPGGVIGTPALGGTASLGAGPIGVARTGSPNGGWVANNSIGVFLAGGFGGNGPFGGAGTGQPNGPGINAVPNTGSGGGGGGTNGTAAAAYGGPGGPAGGYIDAIINAPAATYTYTIGTGGPGGAAGTSGFNGGSGADGYAIVEEYYGS